MKIIRYNSLFILLITNHFYTFSYSDIAAWEQFIQTRYASQEKEKDDFRDFENNASQRVKEFYRLNHRYQTVNFVLKKKEEYSALQKKRLSIWDAFHYLDTLVDESDPDLSLPQSYHALQTAEALRNDGQPRWLILTGLIHDLGKILTLFGEPQWAVVGDTFPVGCAYANAVAFHDYFNDNPDKQNDLYQTKYGIYKPGCGLRNVHMSWGHDEYLYYVVKNYLPESAAYIIRYHSFYAAHCDGAYTYLMDDYDKEMLAWVGLFNKYDLYSKSSNQLDMQEHYSYYAALVAEYFPDIINW